MGSENTVDVIRCKDCDFFIGSDYSNTGHCCIFNAPVIKDGFCYHGERTEENV